MKKRNKNITRFILDDYKKCLSILYKEKLILQSYDLEVMKINGVDEITWSTKKIDFKNLSYDKMIEVNKVLENIIDNKQFLIRFYDGSIFSYQLKIKNNQVCKGNILFIKVQDRSWKDEDMTWQDFQYNEETDTMLGCPICIRIDIDTNKHDDVHSICHLTLSNYESCRIPINRILSISDCLSFIMVNFYDKCNLITPLPLFNECITEKEKKKAHLKFN